ncbi:DUF928 domain-containing protein [Aerosakkonemataceae cyanobacterium BLCC-F50]|uniref:DUF928 domain-containing protein n=1 Tax=Floridaenema flaviceps BLCC-F50 TaxID=3153642 RepID=A0ABV4Y4R6_9CYAN
MNNQNFLLIFTSYLCAIAVFPTQILALTTIGQKEAISPKGMEIAEYKPRDRGVPSQTASGASRGGKCEQDNNIPGPPLSALVPANDTSRLTVEGKPDFFVYIPQSSAQMAEFVLKDENQKNLYRTTFPISGKAEIVEITLPNNVYPLEKNQKYYWYFTVFCNTQNRSRNPFINESIERTEINSPNAAQVEKASLRDRSNFYAENGIWHDAVANLAQLRRQTPNDATLVNEWKKLLQSAGLEEFSDFPVTLAKLENSP